MTDSQNQKYPHLDAQADPPTVGQLEQIGHVVEKHLGDGVVAGETKIISDEEYLVYLNATIPYALSLTTQDNKGVIQYVGYGPVGAVRAYSQDNGEYFELEIPDRDAVERALDRRKHYEQDLRAAVLTDLKHTLDDRREMHFEEYKKHEPEQQFDNISELDLSEEELYDYAFNRGMHKMAQLLSRQLHQNWDKPYNGFHSWDK